jgi:hypothetical protein
MSVSEGSSRLVLSVSEGSSRLVLSVSEGSSRFPIPDVADDEVIVLRKYSSEVEATMAHLVLEAHNIPSAMMRDNAGGMIPSMAILYPVRLAVRREDADEARRILDAEAPLPAEDGGEEVIDDPETLGASWSPERDRDDDDQPDEPEDSESDRRW